LNPIEDSFFHDWVSSVMLME